MAKSKVIKAEVLTIYTVEVSFADFCEMKAAWIDGKHGWGELFPEAFTNEDTTLGVLHEEYREFRPHIDRNKLVVAYLGYDGWKTALMYKESTKSLLITVYNMGAQL